MWVEVPHPPIPYGATRPFRQLMPNSWRIVVSCMGIWLAAMDGDMLRIDELVYLYRLKASKEYGYHRQGITLVFQVLEIQVFLCVGGRL